MNLVLMGMMGSGKSAIGRTSARILARPFFDVDSLIQTHFGLSIPAIFSTLGEPAFRQAEEIILLRLAAKKRRAVISLGGGSVLSQTGMTALKSVSKCIYLRGSVETLLKRAGKRMHRRPLLMNAQDPEKVLAELLQRREGLYLKYADMVLDINMGSIEGLAQVICEKVGAGL